MAGKTSRPRTPVKALATSAFFACRNGGRGELLSPVSNNPRAAHGQNAAFRDAGRGLLRLRDAIVLIETYDGLLDAFDDQVNRRRFAPIRRRLTAQRKDAARHAHIRTQFEKVQKTL